MKRFFNLYPYWSGFAVWVLGVACHGLLYVYSTLHGPPIPDAYANEIWFQLMAFFIVRFPYWFATLILLILCVRFYKAKKSVKIAAQ